jgi:RNA polymerase sigma factor (sigma-70 family)
VEGTRGIARLEGRLTEADEFVALYRRESELVLMFCARRVLDAETALDLTA